MKVNINIIPRPFCVEFTMLAKPNIEVLKETKKVTVEGRFETKTRIDTKLQIGKSRHGINIEVEGFKTDMVTEHSYLSNTPEHKAYFKKSKKQGKDEYINYVKEVVKIAINDYLKVELDEVTVDLILPEFN